jgi:hypothetical protein
MPLAQQLQRQCQRRYPYYLLDGPRRRIHRLATRALVSLQLPLVVLLLSRRIRLVLFSLSVFVSAFFGSCSS